MAVPTNTFQTYQAKGNREALIDLIYNIAPTDVPFMSGIRKVETTATKHEWQTDTLAAAAANAQIEGDDASAAAVTASTRWDNYTQISRKNFIISGTQDAVKKAGRKSEINYQKVKFGNELKRDMEFALTQNTTYNAGAAGTARQLRGLEGWIYTNGGTTGNGLIGATGALPAPSSNTAPTDGTARALTEAMIKTSVQLCWASGGQPDVLMVGAAQKQTVSGFSGNATRFQEADANKLYAAFDVYVSDFGALKVVPNRFQRSRTAFVLDMSYWKLAVLQGRDMVADELGQTGDGRKFQIITEYTLEASNEAASGTVRDLS